MEEFNSMETFRDRGIKALDVEHMITRSPPDSDFPTCHGIFVTNRSARVKGTISFRKDIAGDVITYWRVEP